MAADFDDVLNEVGEFGRYQKVLVVLLCLPAAIPCAFYSLILVFLQAAPQHWCHVPRANLSTFSADAWKNHSIPLEEHDGQTQYSSCHMYSLNDSSIVQDCSEGWEYDHQYYDSTIVTDWDLVCSKDWVPNVVFAVFNVGSLIGNMAFGWLQDRIGRRPSFFFCLTIQLVAGVLTVFSGSIYVFTVLRFFIGLTVPSLFNIPLVLVVELVGPRKRTFVTLLLCFLYSASLVLLPGIAYAVRDWKFLALATSVPFVLFYLYWWFMPESPRWLVAVGQVDRAQEQVIKMARQNKADVTDAWIVAKFEEIADAESRSAVGTVNPKQIFGIVDLFRTPNVRRKTIIISIIWVSNVMVYTGLSYYIPSLFGSPYLNSLLAAVAEMPAYIFLFPFLDKWGRRWPLCASMILAGVACVCTVWVPSELGSLQVVLAVIGKCGISTSFIVMYIFTAEIYPTVVRGIGLGFSSFIAGAGNVGLPFIIYLGTKWMVLPVVIMGVLAWVGGIVGLFLPETLHTPLPESIADAEALATESPFNLCCPRREAPNSNNVLVPSTDYKLVPLEDKLPNAEENDS